MLTVQHMRRLAYFNGDGIPESEIAIKTANKDELKNIDLSSLIAILDIL